LWREGEEIEGDIRRRRGDREMGNDKRALGISKINETEKGDNKDR
jgi:hypothetical protein